MAEIVTTQKLAAILHADVVNYSRLMGEDEAGTHRLLKEYLDTFALVISDHQGRVVNYAGDAVLADFATVSDALRCAATIQQAIKKRNEVLPDQRKILFRIGINLGEVIVDRDNIYGDGVNIAARLESLAEPGGICLSESARSAIGKKLPFSYRDMGEQEIKNITEPVKAYQVVFEQVANGNASVQSPPSLSISILNWWLIAFGIVGIAIATISYQWLWKQTEARITGHHAQPVELTSEYPSIAVLPFINMSADPQQEYFADGMTEDLITDLSKISGLFVIARSSTFAYKGKSMTAQQIKQELDVRYILEGSVRKAGDQIRVNTQLIDTRTGGSLWAERYDRQLQDIFALQDEITEQIITTLSVKLTEQERKLLSTDYTNNLEAYDYFLRGQEQLFLYSNGTYKQARELFRKAIKLDPTFARAYSALAVTYTNQVMVGYSDKTEEFLARALELTNTAIALDDTMPQAYFAQGYVLLYKGQHDEAVASLQKALTLAPSYADGYSLLAFIYAHMIEKVGKTLTTIERGLQLNPNYTMEYLGIQALAYYWAEQYNKAEQSLQRALARNPNFLFYRLYLVSTYVRLDQMNDAGWEVEEVLTLNPNFSLTRWAQEQPFQKPQQITSLLNDLRQAGLPE